MCGITGFIVNEAKRRNLESKKEIEKISTENVLTKMMNQMIHRGPEGSGIYVDSHIALGHRRLSIIDLEGGRQPMANEDGRFVCIFNGEIYNYLELRKELEKAGHIFSTNSDTEVLIHGYETWKEDLSKKLRGMFAFAIWDRQEKELFCSRDPFGIKLYLTYQYSPGKNTFFKNVFKLSPAHSLCWKNGKMNLFSYWKPEFTPYDEMKKAGGIEEIGRAMEDSIKAHKISDVEVGSFLSSGMDSSYIAVLSKVKKTFTIGYENEKYNEGEVVKEFAESMNLSNQIFHVNPETFWESISKVQYYMDEPLADASAVSLYLLNQEASKHVKVCLSGEGADELFVGYNIYKELCMWKWYDRIPERIRRGIGMAAGLMPSMPGVNFLVRHSLPLKWREIWCVYMFLIWYQVFEM